MDATEEFLARERELLGEDAALFGNPITQDAAPSAAGVDFGAFEAAPQEQPDLFGNVPAFGNAHVENGDGDLFGNPVDQAPMEFANGVAAGVPGIPTEADATETEPEAVRTWRENFEMAIADRDARASTKDQETIQAASESLARFYAEYNDKVTKTIARNKENEKSVLELQESTAGTIWERVVKQIDVSATTSATASKLKEKMKADGKDEKSKKPLAGVPKQKDTSRMRSLLISLKADKNAPGNDK